MSTYGRRAAPSPPHPAPPVPAAGRGARAAPRARAARAAVALAAGLVALVLAVPLVFLLIEAGNSGWATLRPLLFRQLTVTLLWNTVRLTVVVTASVRGDRHGRSVVRGADRPARAADVGRAGGGAAGHPGLRGQLRLGVAVPSWIQGFRGAVLVMTLAIYPLVYLPVAASLRGADPGQEEVARSLGTGRVRTFLRITLGQARGAILGGCLLVAMVMLAEYGAFEIVGYQTFTTEIFTEFHDGFSLPAACALSLVLVLLSLLVLGVEGLCAGPGPEQPVRAARPRVSPPQRLGPGRAGRCSPRFVPLIGLALGVPAAASIYWILQRRAALADLGLARLAAAWYTALYSALAGRSPRRRAAGSAPAVRHPGGRARRALERSTYLVLAMPGRGDRAGADLLQRTLPAGGCSTRPGRAISAYAIMFFPLALVGVKASLAQCAGSLDEVARSLGPGRLAVALRVTLRLTGPGLAAAFCLVFLAVITELTATLILIPTGVQTLATQFWAYETNLSYAQAAPFALVMIAVAAIPSIVLGRFFNSSADPGR